MCIYTLKKKKKIEYKNSSRGMRDSTDITNIRRLRRKGLRYPVLHTGKI